MTVQIIKDSDLPKPHDWALVQLNERDLRLFVKASAYSHETLAAGWAAFWQLCGRTPVEVLWAQPKAPLAIAAAG